jgi:hypothetical protein
MKYILITLMTLGCGVSATDSFRAKLHRQCSDLALSKGYSSYKVSYDKTKCYGIDKDGVPHLIGDR